MINRLRLLLYLHRVCVQVGIMLRLCK